MNIAICYSWGTISRNIFQFSASSRGCVTLTLHLTLKGQCFPTNPTSASVPPPQQLHRVSKKTSHLWLATTLTHMNGFWYFFGRNVTDKAHLWLATTMTHMNGFWYFFGRNVTDKVGNQKTLYYATSNNLCICTTWQNAETRTSHISLNWTVLHTQCTCALSSWKKNLSCDVFDSV